jgi:arginase
LSLLYASQLRVPDSGRGVETEQPSASSQFAVIEAPSNLGLRPPETGAVPGADKSPAALREAGLQEHLRGMGGREAGVVLAGRYLPDFDSGAVRNQTALIDHSRRLGRRIGQYVDARQRILVLGGDCSILLGAALGLRSRGRFGLVHIDGHTDFRHPGNSASFGSLAGEDLAAAVGLHLPQISDIDGLGPYFRPDDTVHLGCRDNDEHLEECRTLLADTVTAREWLADPTRAAEAIQAVTNRPGLAGTWVHVDVDVLDPEVLPAVDSPDPGGVEARHLAGLLAKLWPICVGLQVCVFDPDLDPTGKQALLLASILIEAIDESETTGCP